MPTLDGGVYAEPLVYNGVVYTATPNNTVYAHNQIAGSIYVFAVPTSGGAVGAPYVTLATGRLLTGGGSSSTTPPATSS